ncbi:aspartate/glutamate racemase family protein [Salipiger mangrovisoli]|uniref:Aspartate/glutamate racemase family protein n=1 Tax=Salipiger mangrovisoli TaxID=2865933 RepID=A0ABR9XBI2_9RHOB|nr:aspartate/glutamate racemase family protein [Salipiger mangrovisoli]MBE9640787.1 aspartate/glutamate racemase family protein [Salipiger mangrovisoli]
MQIAVLNPNSSRKVTTSMNDCLAPLIATTRHAIICDTLEEGPEGIETDQHVADVVPMVIDYVRRTKADAFVIACFSDPGVQQARKVTDKPVFGIAESAYCAALVHGARFGVVSLGPSSIARHLARIDGLGLTTRLAGDRSVDMTVAEANDVDAARAAVTRTGRALIHEDGAEVLILGCAGMGGQRQELQAALGRVVIDPVQAAVANAISALDLDYTRKGS